MIWRLSEYIETGRFCPARPALWTKFSRTTFSPNIFRVLNFRTLKLFKAPILNPSLYKEKNPIILYCPDFKIFKAIPRNFEIS